MEKAKEGATDLAQIAKVKIEITRLIGQRTEATGELGRQVYALYGQGRTMPEVETVCQQIRRIDDQIKQLEAKIAHIQQGIVQAPATAQQATPQASVTVQQGTVVQAPATTKQAPAESSSTGQQGSGM